MYVYEHISLIFLKMRNGSEKICRESRNTCVMFHALFSKIVRLCDNVNNFVEPGRL